MARAIVQVTLERKNALPADAIVNTWHFESDDAFGTSAPGLADRISTFYQSLGLWFGAQLSGNADIKMYDFDDPKPRVPVHVDDFTFTPSTAAFPAECCVCLSMEAEQQSGTLKARRRGRVYLGPINGGPMSQASSDVRIPEASRQELVDKANTMAVGGSGAFRLAIYSPTTQQSGGTVDESWHDVTTLWVDDAIDIQRRRGQASTQRTTKAVG